MRLAVQRHPAIGGWPQRPAGRIPLVDVDPDLAAGRSIDREQSIVPVFRFADGPMPMPPEGVAGPLGFMVLKGLLIYQSAVSGKAAAELAGPGDVIRAGVPAASTLAPRAAWTALEPTLLGDLNRLEAPGILRALAIRHADRADRIAIERSIGSHVRVDVRVLAYLWHLADRFAVVVPDGVRLDLPLTHAILARLIGARRPTVTTALQKLIQLGYLAREGRSFRLIGDSASVEELDRRSPAHGFAFVEG